MINKCYYKTPIGNICIEAKDGFITALYTCDHEVDITEECDVINNAYKQLLEYFDGSRKEFDIPIKLVGTEFQLKVWNELKNIPYGETRSYGDIAKYINNPKASRAIGGANNKNPIMIIVPCHRVIGVNGKLVGFGAGLDVKKYLLHLEEKNNNKL